jgi:putative transposase
VASRRALKRSCPEIHHSDQGVQDAATSYVELLTDHEVKVSMASVGVPKESGHAGRLMRTIKGEEVALSEYEDLADAQRQLGRFLDDVYNTKQIHSSLGYPTPEEFASEYREKYLASA